ncbi:MAG TPA: hypothetical protein PKI20_18830 [Verrucomicrobiota bacterium]|jgi:hypothetical protein|nr:hypothetical protein [Verrucomicrobiota bacterium]HQL79797.1 hypothetical protein [Verrucomicrobiota bacterium]
MQYSLRQRRGFNGQWALQATHWLECRPDYGPKPALGRGHAAPRVPSGERLSLSVVVALLGHPWPGGRSVGRGRGGGRDIEPGRGFGRLRKDCALDNGLRFWVAGGQLLNGAALKALRIAEERMNDRPLSETVED